MKSIMYHYIRNKNKLFPYSNILEKKIFLKQLKKFSKAGFINSNKDLFSNNDKLILTFDDGFKDHVYAAETLKKNHGIGLFFIPTLPLINHEILDVHKTHLLLGKIKVNDVFEELENYLSINKIKNFYNKKLRDKYIEVYNHQHDSFLKKDFKKIMNYHGNLKYRKKILNYLLDKFEINIKSKNFYLNKKEIKYISSLGMIIGSHAESHTLLSKLSYKKQFSEINNSKLFLEKIIKKKIDIFCYPYGGKKSYNKNTLTILKKLKFKLAYSVENRDINLFDIKNNPFELPRYNCNLF